MPPSTSPTHSWHIVVPVRGGLAGKTRLRNIEGHPLTETDRMALAGAMAADTVSAAVESACGPVSVLTADEETAALAARLGADTLDDPGGGLNACLTAALSRLAPDTGAAVLLGDVPTARGPDLVAVLTMADRVGRAYVPDWEGTGTTMVAFSAPMREHAVMGFGAGSARRHASLGLVPIGLHLDRLRCDVDTPQAWDRALSLGFGPVTAAARDRLLERSRQ